MAILGEEALFYGDFVSNFGEEGPFYCAFERKRRYHLFVYFVLNYAGCWLENHLRSMFYWRAGHLDHVILLVWPRTCFIDSTGEF